MSGILYLLRQPADRISTSIFLASENKGDVVVLDEAATSVSSSKGQVYAVGHTDSPNDTSLTYEELLDRIFAHDHVMVI